MTIAVTIKTGSAVVFAADSKITTSAFAGLLESGKPNWVVQTYDNAYKLAHDRDRQLMAMVVGDANVGTVPAADFIAACGFPGAPDLPRQDESLDRLLASMANECRSYWSSSKLPEAQWPGPSLVVALAAPDGRSARVFWVSLRGGKFEKKEILKRPGIHLEGNPGDVFTLLYGFDAAKAEVITGQLQIDNDKFVEAWRRSRNLSAIDKLNVASMPIQDAMDLAEFLAYVQVQMDRFLPGEAACGGPIDLMVLQLFPHPAITEFAGKTLHHPRQSS